MEFKILNRLKNSEIANSETWVGEALFGFGKVSHYCEKLAPGSAILEIGCGSGILLSMLKEKFPRLKCFGIEPFGSGFDSLRALNHFVQSQGIEIHNSAYESFLTERAYDLIFCINVFEHLADWQDFLKTASNWLKPKGTLVVLCPNYGFPYESHFHIPVLLNKDFTFKVFKNHISRFEEQNQVEGLWQSLNFVSKKPVKLFVNELAGLELNDRLEIFDEMIERLSTDEALKNRHGLLSKIAIAMNKVHLAKIFRLFPNQLPYMHIEIQKS